MKPRNYQCRKCGKINQITTLRGMLFTPHLGWHKWLKCECGAKRHYQRRVFQPEMNIREELKLAYETIAALEVDLDRAQRECDEADGYYCSLIDNLRDDIKDLKQELRVEENMFHQATKELAERDKLLANAEAETAKKIIEDIEQISYFGNPKDFEILLAERLYELKKKYGVED